MIPIGDQLITSYDSNKQLATGLARYTDVELMSVVVIQSSAAGNASAVAYNLGKPKISTKPSGEKGDGGIDLYEFEMKLRKASGTGEFAPGSASGFVQGQTSSGDQIEWEQDAATQPVKVT